ncbi:MAG: hypothetical protein RLN87_01440 [Parasphingopyxis sp.]|uniref:hypothetical protein n=1 Tax=Parasphingopyxis sp. TaxID=1920299 RepID=UPI002629B10A|nr:hypothetical protein [uncultured Parasphingopyxis sp.]
MIEKKACLLSAPRTGSTMITRALFKHPQAYFIGAIFSRKGWDGAGRGHAPLTEGLGEQWNDLDFRLNHHRELMDRLFNLDVAPCIGFKHHLSNDRSIVETVLADDSIAKIVLTRPNMLATFSSNIIARAKNETPAGEEPPKQMPFDAEEFRLHIKRRQRMLDSWEPQIAAAGERCLRITYTEARTDAGMDRILDFLGLETTPLERITKKRNSDSVIDRFTNPDEALTFLKEEGLEDWADETVPEAV